MASVLSLTSPSAESMQNLGSSGTSKGLVGKTGRGVVCSYSWYGLVLIFSDLWAFGSIRRVSI